MHYAGKEGEGEDGENYAQQARIKARRGGGLGGRSAKRGKTLGLQWAGSCTEVAGEKQTWAEATRCLPHDERHISRRAGGREQARGVGKGRARGRGTGRGRGRGRARARRTREEGKEEEARGEGEGENEEEGEEEEGEEEGEKRKRKRKTKRERQRERK